MVDDELKKCIHREIEKATVKIFVYNEFQGTGFFITPDGHLLTAYHCLLTQSQVVIETNSGKKYDAKLEQDKSVRDEDNDGVTVLKADCNPLRYLPLGILSEYDHAHVSDEVVALGYPAEHRSENHQIGTYFGKISRFRKDNKIEIPDAIKGEGQSGGPIYHYKTKNVVGLVLEGYKDEVIRNTGLAMDFKELFASWDDNFKNMTNEVAKSWEKRLAVMAKVQPVTNFFGAEPTRISIFPFLPRKNDDTHFLPEHNYFRLTLVQMALREGYGVTSQRYPVVYSNTDFSVIGGTGARSTVVSPMILGQSEPINLERVLIRNQDLTGYIAFRGGSINLALGLYSVPENDWANQFFSLIRTLTDVTASNMLNLTTVVKRAFDELTGNGKMTLQVGLKLDINSGLQKYQYVAIIAETRENIDQNKLNVSNATLHYDGQPLEQNDFILLKVEFSSAREDLPRLEISRSAEEFLKKAALLIVETAIKKKNPATEERLVNEYQLFIAQVFSSSESLIASDRTRLISSVDERIKELYKAFQISENIVQRSAAMSPDVLVKAAIQHNPRLFKIDLQQEAPVKLFDSITEAMQFPTLNS